MENKIYTFDQYLAEMKKNYGEKIKPEEFAKLKKGSEIVYRGVTYKIVAQHEHSIDVETKDGKPKKLNLNMFNEFGAIR